MCSIRIIIPMATARPRAIAKAPPMKGRSPITLGIIPAMAMACSHKASRRKLTLDRLPVLGLVDSLLLGVQCQLPGVERLLLHVVLMPGLVVRDLRLHLGERVGDGQVRAHSRSLQGRDAGIPCGGTPVLRC